MKAFLVTMFALGLAGCKHEEKLAAVYTAQCLEAVQIPLRLVGPQSTCNGGPLIFAFRTAGPVDDAEMYELFQALEARGFDLDVREAATGRTALMLAAAHPDPRWFAYVHRASRAPDAIDRAGRTFAHYAAENKEFRGGRLAFAGADLTIRDAAGKTAAQLAYDVGNYDVAWALLEAGAPADFLVARQDDVDPSFLRNVHVERNSRVLDSLPRTLARNSDRLADLASERCLPRLAEYLAVRGLLGARTLPCAHEALSGPRSEFFKTLARLGPGDQVDGMAADIWWMNPGYRDELGHTLAHVYFDAVASADYDRDWNVRQGGFTRFLDLASVHGWLNQPDVLGLTPAFYWLASPHRAEERGFFAARTARANWAALLARVADPGARSSNGDSLLTFAVLTRQLGLVKTALDGAPVLKSAITQKNRQGRSPLDLAQEHSLWDIYGYLRKIK